MPCLTSLDIFGYVLSLSVLGVLCAAVLQATESCIKGEDYFFLSFVFH